MMLSARRPVHHGHFTLRPLVAAASSVIIPALAACSSVSGMQEAPLRPGPVAAVASAQPAYRIAAGDVLDIRLPVNPELNDEVAVLPDGHISTAVGKYEQAEGLTIPELIAVLKNDYKKILVDPDLSVLVKTTAPNRFFVSGEVVAPGEFASEYPTPTLSQAIARAGGLRLSGDSGNVFILRRGANDTPQFLRTRYSAVVNGKDPTADVRLARYDVVVVPRTGIADVYVAFNQYVQQFLPISWGFQYNIGAGSNNSTSNTAATATGR